MIIEDEIDALTYIEACDNDEDLARTIILIKMTLDKEGTINLLSEYYLDLEGEAPTKNVDLGEWFLQNFVPGEDGWNQKPKMVH